MSSPAAPPPAPFARSVSFAPSAYTPGREDECNSSRPGDFASSPAPKAKTKSDDDGARARARGPPSLKRAVACEPGEGAAASSAAAPAAKKQKTGAPEPAAAAKEPSSSAAGAGAGAAAAAAKEPASSAVGAGAGAAAAAKEPVIEQDRPPAGSEAIKAIKPFKITNKVEELNCLLQEAIECRDKGATKMYTEMLEIVAGLYDARDETMRYRV